MTEIVGPGLLGCAKRAAQLAEKDFPVLIVGETGTGKELIAGEYAAAWCHSRKVEKEAEYAPLNCTGIGDDLLSSELFGHLKGSFTDADKDRPGLVQGHHLILLDELGDASGHFQAQILRLAETGDYKRVGSSEIEHWKDKHSGLKGRLLASTNRPDRIRHDLAQRFHRLELPRLAVRPDDTPPLVAHFAVKFGVSEFTERFAKYAALYTWPGNVRELLRCVEEGSLTGCIDIPVASLSPPNPSLPIRFDLASRGFASESTKQVPIEKFATHFTRHRLSKDLMEQKLLAEQHRRLMNELSVQFHLSRIADVLEESTSKGRFQRSLVGPATELLHFWKHDAEPSDDPGACRQLARIVETLPAQLRQLPPDVRDQLRADVDRAITQAGSVRKLARQLAIKEPALRERLKALEIKRTTAVGFPKHQRD